MFHRTHLLFWVVVVAVPAGADVLQRGSAQPVNSVARFASAPSAAPRPSRQQTALSRLAEIDWKHWSSLEALLTDVHVKTGIPAVAAVYVKDGKIVEQATVGLREAGRSAPVLSDDPFHLGSVTKSMTATVIGRLVDDGTVSWEMTLADALPEIPMRDEYRSVTVENLLQHRGGLPAYTDGPPPGARSPRDYVGSPTEIRAAFVADLLMAGPVGTPGQTYQYSNAGYAMVGYLAERLTGQTWEQLIQKHLFAPLGMSSCGFGFPDQPAGHHGMGPQFTVTPPDYYPPMDLIAPAGNVHCSATDMGRYAISHLAGLAGADGYLKADTVRRLHTAPDDDEISKYAAGWQIRRGADGTEFHQHGGTVHSSYAMIRIDPANNAGVAVLLNVGPNIGEPVTNMLARTILAGPRPAPQSTWATDDGASGTITRQGKLSSSLVAKDGKPMVIPDGATFVLGGGQPAALAGGDTASGFVTKAGDEITFVDDAAPATGRKDKKKKRASRNVSQEPQQPKTVPGKASPEEDARAWAVVRALARAFNDEDEDAYLALFKVPPAEEGNVFDFFMEQVLPARGNVVSFHELSPRVMVDDSKFPVRAVVFHLENGSPGYFGISLDDAGKIDHFSIFVKSDLCPNGVDPLCDKAIVPLEGVR